MTSPADARQATADLAATLNEVAASGPFPVVIADNAFRYRPHGPGTAGKFARKGDVIEVGLADFVRGYAAGSFETPTDTGQVHPTDQLTATQVRDMSVDQIAAYLADQPDQTSHVLAMEQAGKDRKGVRDLAAPAGDDPDDDTEE